MGKRRWQVFVTPQLRRGETCGLASCYDADRDQGPSCDFHEQGSAGRMRRVGPEACAGRAGGRKAGLSGSELLMTQTCLAIRVDAPTAIFG